MGKSRSMEDERAALKKKVQEGKAKEQNSEGYPSFRSLHKRLKRVQRKIRTRVARQIRAQGKKAVPAAS